MNRSLRNVEGYRIEGSDGIEGKVEDFLFDQKDWIIRYIEAEFEDLDRKRVLISRSSIKALDWQQRTVHLNLNKSDIESSPIPENHATVSREYEKEYYKRYELDPYWQYTYVPPVGSKFYLPPRPIPVPYNEIHEDDLGTSLRSFKEVRGYWISEADDSIGQLKDIIIDAIDWQIVYLIIDTSRWLPWSKTVVLSINWLKNISSIHRKVEVKLRIEQIKNAPEFNPSHPIDMDFERALKEFFRKHIKYSTS